MIENECQLQITRTAAERFRKALASMSAVCEGIDPRLVQAQSEALQSQLNDLEAEIAEYVAQH
jgi:hypothetical protein